MYWEDALPIEVKELPEDLAALDKLLLCDPGLLWPLVERWQRASCPGDRAAEKARWRRMCG